MKIVATSGQDNHGHLLGIHAFVNVGDQIMLPGSLSAASYWVGLRQEIYSAMSTQAPVKIRLDHYIVDHSFEPTDDYSWSNRAVVNLAEVLNFCFSETPQPNTRWTYLNEQCVRWEEMRPPSFEPFYFKERGAGDAFPQIWYHSSCHGKALDPCRPIRDVANCDSQSSCRYTASHSGPTIIGPV